MCNLSRIYASRRSLSPRHPRKEAIRLVIGKLQTGDIYEATWRQMFGSWRQDEMCKHSYNMNRLYIHYMTLYDKKLKVARF